MQFLPDWAPNIHPVIVHFPLVLLIFAVLFDIAGLVLTKFEWIKKSALSLYIFGTISAAIAFITGNSASDSIIIPSYAFSAVNDHADWAEITLWFFSIYTIVRLIFAFGFKRIPFARIIIIPLVLSGIVGLYFLYNTGDKGAKLVYGYGLGTGNILKIENTVEQTIEKESLSASTFSVNNNGSWKLIATEDVIKILSQKFKWIEGSLEEINPMYESSDSVIMFHLDEEKPLTAGFVYDNKIKSVQMTVKINLDNFNGELELIHNLIDRNNYDLLGLKKNEIYLARKSNGELEYFKKDKFKGNDWLEIKVVSEGTHFRGYINNKLYTHGHGSSPQPGSAGIKFSGTGIISIKSINVESL